MMRRSKCVPFVLLVVATISLRTGWAFQTSVATPSVDRPIISPVSIPAGRPVPVTVSTQIHTGPTDPQVIAAGVYLLRYDAANRFIANLGVMHDDGINGDAVAGDQVFSLRFNLNEPSGELRVAASVPFVGTIPRIISEVASARIVGNTPPVANAGPDQTVTLGATVRLDGSGSSDIDGDPLTFRWSFVSVPSGSAAALVNPTTVNPTFVVDRPGNYAVQLVVNDGTVDSAPDVVVISTANSRPVANAGPDQTVPVGTDVMLDGSASSDADGDPLTFSWSLVSVPPGSGAVLVNPTAVRPTLRVNVAGVYIVQLIVNDGRLASLPDTVIITTANTAPVANAGPDQRVVVGQTVQLDGSGSTDADGDPLTFSWSFISRPAGSTATLSNPNIVKPTFVADVAGAYVIQLIVNDGHVNSSPDTVMVTTGNTRPVANAGPDQRVTVGSLVHLDGSASSDVDGDPLTFAWSFISKPAGSVAVLSSTSAVKPTFVADLAGTYTLQLIVNDGSLNSDPDTVVITTGNTAPVANAGPDQTVSIGSTVVLDGSGSSDAEGDPLTFNWSFVSRPAGSTATLINPTSVRPMFVVDVGGTYVVQLIVNDGSLNSLPDTVAITTGNSRPVANAGPDQSVTVGSLVNLDGSGSSDVDGDPLTFSWSFTSRPAGSTAVLSNPTAINPTFTADIAGVYVVQLIVNDGLLDSLPDTVTITVSETALPTVTLTATDAAASEAGPDPGTFTFTRSGPTTAALVVLYSIGGTATNGTDYTPTLSGSVTIPAGQASAAVTVTPVQDNLVEGAETVVVTLTSNPAYTIGSPNSGTVTIADNPAIVQVAATDPNAFETGPDPGVFTFTRSGGDVSSALQVFFTVSGTATPGVDYLSVGGSVTIPANELSVNLTITPITDTLVEGDETVVATISSNASYTIGSSGAATVTIHDASSTPLVSVTAIDSSASEVGPDVGVFRFTRTGSTTSPLTVTYSIGGTATNGADYVTIGTSIVIPAGQASADLTITPIADAISEPAETVVITVTDGADYDVGSPASATVTIADAGGSSCGPEGGPLVNGATHCGTISNPGETDTWTFTANAGDRIAIHIGEVVDFNDFRPWIRLVAPGGATVGNTSGTDAAALDLAATATGTYQVIVASFDAGFNGTGTYLLTMAHTPGPITISAGDQGGPLTNGAIHTGEIFQGDLDTWTFTANAGDRIAVHIGQITDTDDFRPWIRIWAPNGVVVGDTSGTDAAALDVRAPVTGTYLVLVASFDAGFDGTGTYRLTMTHTPGPITVSDGDQGGPLTNGAIHTGEILKGDVDVWTFTANIGDRIAVHIGEITDNDDFRPWIRIWAPNGVVVGDTSGTDAAALDVAAPVTGNYLVLVASFDSGFDGSGTYRLTMAHTPGPITVSPDDEGGPLTNGLTHFGEIVQGDVDVWTFTANAADRIAVHVGQITDTDDFRPWIRIWAPNGVVVGDTSGTDAAALDVRAPVTGTYLVLVASFDSGFDGTGTYRLTMTHTPGPITVAADDQGGPLTNGAIHTGEILKGDVDVWTFTATMGDRIAVHIGEITDNDDFRPWIRIWAPNGVVVGDTSGTDAAALDVAAPVTGTYLVLVASFDSGFDGTGTYRLTMTHTPGPITVSPGDEGGPLTNGSTHLGEIVQGDLDVWTFTANAGERIAVHIGEITDTDDFRPWIRIWAPNGVVVGDTSGTDAAALDVAAPVTGTYLVLVASFDSGFDGTGTYRLTMTHTPGPITISPGDEGGPVTLGAIQSGAIVQGDLDVWTVTATAGQRITVQISQTSETDDFRPWIRLWAPNGAVLGNVSGLDAATINSVLAPVSGTYLILVASFDSGFDGTGTYNLTVTIP